MALINQFVIYFFIYIYIFLQYLIIFNAWSKLVKLNVNFVDLKCRVDWKMVQNDFNKIAVKMFLIKYMLLSMYFQKMTLHLDLEIFKEPFV